MSILEKIQSIKVYKLQLAEKALSAATNALAARRKDVVAANKNLNDYVNWRVAEEVRLDKLAFASPMTLKALDELHFKIGLLRAKDVTLRQLILDSEKQVDTALAFKVECQAKVHRAEKQLEKYRLLLKQDQKKRKKQQDIAEEQSLDEFVTRQRA